MTFIVQLEYAHFENGITVMARSVQTGEQLEPRYEILRYNDYSDWTERIPCAKTTWRKKFREILVEEGSKQE